MINQIPIKIEKSPVREEPSPAKSEYMEIEEGRIYKLGNKTFWLFFFNYAKWFVLIGLLLCALVFEMYFGALTQTTDTYLHESWYDSLSKNMLASWIIMIGLSIIFVGYLRAYVLYRQYKFHLTENAFHVRRGIFSIKEIVIAYHQIQNVEIRRPYHYRMMGLSKLDISLSNNIPLETHLKGSNQSTLLPVLDKTLAASLAHELVRRGSAFGNDLTRGR